MFPPTGTVSILCRTGNSQGATCASWWQAFLAPPSSGRDAGGPGGQQEGSWRWVTQSESFVDIDAADK